MGKGTPDDLYRQPQSLFIAGFIGSPPINVISGEARDGAVRVGPVVLHTEGAAGAVTSPDPRSKRRPPRLGILRALDQVKDQLHRP